MVNNLKYLPFSMAQKISKEDSIVWLKESNKYLVLNSNQIQKGIFFMLLTICICSLKESYEDKCFFHDLFLLEIFNCIVLCGSVSVSVSVSVTVSIFINKFIRFGVISNNIAYVFWLVFFIIF